MPCKPTHVHFVNDGMLHRVVQRLVSLPIIMLILYQRCLASKRHHCPLASIHVACPTARASLHEPMDPEGPSLYQTESLWTGYLRPSMRHP